MAAKAVTTTPDTIPIPATSRLLVQNLGPDKLYFGRTPVTAATGIEMAVGDIYEVPVDSNDGFQTLNVTSAGTSDVRYMII